MSARLLTGYERLPGARARHFDAVCNQFEQSWRAGGRPAIEAYLGEVSGFERLVLVRELLLVEVPYRWRAGDVPSAEEYRARFPDLEDAWLAQVVTAPAAHTLPSAPPAGPPPAVPGYDILRELGRGGMGVVYQARDTCLGRFVALKFLSPEAARDPRRLERFRREARAASALNHPAVCTLYGVGECQGQPFLVLEFVEGQTLRALVGPCPDLARLLPLFRQVAEALRVAHAAGVVHRDLKPENLMVRPDGYVKVLDFGLARLPRPPAGAGPPAVDTDPGALIGTMGYMSPEQARAERAGSASDIFSLGIVLYELATGRHPFQAGAGISTLLALAAEPVVPPTPLNPEVPAPLAALILQMLDMDPRRRPTAAEVEAVLADLTGGGAAPASGAAAPPGCQPTLGRDPERAALRAAFESAAAGRGLVLCVTGEPGIGKTTLVEDFLAELSAQGSVHASARGRCSESVAGAEAYLPVLEALDSLVRGEAGDAAARALRHLAPSWHAQIVPQPLLTVAPLSQAGPARLGSPDFPVAGGSGEGAGECPTALAPAASQERLRRELLALLEEVSRLRPLVFFMDDVHWADASTVDLLAYLGGRCAGLRLLLLLTYRPTEMLLGRHPFVSVRQVLQSHGLCREVPLGFLGRAEVENYLGLAFPGHQFPADFVDLLRDKTGGNPLFLVDLLRYLRDRGVIAEQPGGWALAQAVPDFQRELPESVRGLIQKMIAQPGEAERRLLSAASVQGHEFDSAVVARVLGRDATEVEERLEVLDHVHGLVRLRREQYFPDGTLSLRYQFVHVLYQNAVYAALQPTRRRAWSAAAAAALLGCHQGQGAAVAGELARLFEAGLDYARAADHFLQAAEQAVRVAANQEAILLARRGLALLQALPDTPTRARQERALLLALGVSLVATQGFASPEVEQTYVRARALCGREEDLSALFPALYGLWNLYLVRCDLARCKELATQIGSLARGQSDPVFLLVAHNVLQQPLFHLGELVEARRQQEQGLARYDRHQHRTLTAVYGEDPGVGCLVYGAATLWHLGYPEQAVQSLQASRSLAEELAHPFNVAQALYYGAFTHLCRREARLVEESAGALMELCREQDFALLLAGGVTLHGWSLAAQGQVDKGISQMRQGLADWQATGALSHRPYHLALLAEALRKEGRTQESLTAVAEALATATATGERFWEAELHRLQGELLLTRAETEPSAHTEAEACFRQALAVARRQQAKSLELRAVMSLGRLYRQQRRQAEARPLLAETYGWFTEGFTTPDLQEAKALLEELSG
jgi:predicted ATPase